MDASEIKGRESLRRWLEGRSREDEICIVQRMALRVFPDWGEQARDYASAVEVSEVLPALRSLLTSGVAQRHPIPEIRAAAKAATKAIAGVYGFDRNGKIFLVEKGKRRFSAAAAYASFLSAGEELDPWTSFSSTLLPSSSALENVERESYWEAVQADALALQSGADPITTPLWFGTPPEWFTISDILVRTIWARDPEIWDFWLRWWDGMLVGKPLDWTLQRDVALILDDVWKEGPVAVKVEIDRIEINHIVNRTPHAEIIDRDASGLFYATPVVTLPPTVFQNAKDKVSDAVAEVRARLGHNQIAAILPDLDLLDRYSARYADNPLRLHDEFEKLKARIDLLVRQGELSPHDLIGDLRAALDSGAIDIRRSDKEVAKVIKGRTAERLVRLRKDRTPKVEAALAQAQAEARPDLRQELQEDLATADKPATNDAETTAQENAAYRAVSRMSRMAKRAKDDTVKLADDAGKVAKGVEAAGKAAEAAPVWWETVTNWLSGLFF
jgi:hypothetical protein